MGAGIAEAWPLALAGLAVLGLTLLAWHRMRRVRVRQRVALVETGLQLALDACAPEGGMVNQDEFRAVRLRAVRRAPGEPRRG